jgi:hypothetical protein
MQEMRLSKERGNTPDGCQAGAHVVVFWPQVEERPDGHQRHPEAEAHRDGQDEARTASEVPQADDLDSGDAHVGKQEGGHAAQHAVRDRSDEASNLNQSAKCVSGS